MKKEDFEVTLLGCTENAQALSVAGALGCFEEKSSTQLLDELLSLDKEERMKKEAAVLKNSFGKGHGSVGDQNYFIFGIEDLPRAVTFQLCLPEYLAHLQQSLRRARASKGFYLPEAIKGSKLAGKTEEVLSRAFQLYEKMVQGGIPGEDARYLLPLYTKTNIQTGGNARELSHLWQMSRKKEVPSIVTAVVDEIMDKAKETAPNLFKDFGSNYETLAWYPSAQLYSAGNQMIRKLISETEKRNGKKDVFLVDESGLLLQMPITDEMMKKAIEERNETELANLKHIHFEFLAFMSLASLHQAIRQRTWNHTLESIYDAAKSGDRMVIPPSVSKSGFLAAYKRQHKEMIRLYGELLGARIPDPEAIGVVPHSLGIYTLIHVNGWNAIHSIGKRTCSEAQWEIRKIAWKIAIMIKKDLPVLGKWAQPQCVIYGKCPEIKDCGYYEKWKRQK